MREFGQFTLRNEPLAQEPRIRLAWLPGTGGAEIVLEHSEIPGMFSRIADRGYGG